METKDPALTKTPINSHEALGDIIANGQPHPHHEHHEVKGTQTLQETVIGSDYRDDGREDGNIVDEAHVNPSMNILEDDIKNTDTFQETMIGSEYSDHHDIEANTSVNKGTDTFKKDVVETEHVNDGDNPARQPDRRDQQGSSAFDEGINDETVGSEAPQSEGITDMNRYANIDNAQTRVLNPDEKD